MGNVIKNRPDENTVGGRLLKMMELNKDSMASLARKTGMVHVTVFDLVHNNRNSTDYNNLRKIAEHYNISLDWLIGREVDSLDCSWPIVVPELKYEDFDDMQRRILKNAGIKLNE